MKLEPQMMIPLLSPTLIKYQNSYGLISNRIWPKKRDEIDAFLDTSLSHSQRHIYWFVNSDHYKKNPFVKLTMFVFMDVGEVLILLHCYAVSLYKIAS